MYENFPDESQQKRNLTALFHIQAQYIRNIPLQYFTKDLVNILYFGKTEV